MKNFILICCFFSALSLFSQIENDSINLTLKPWHQITKFNGIKYLGKIISDNGREILIDTKELGKIYINKSEIKSMEIIVNEKDIASGDYIKDGFFTTRYFITTNALPIKKGEDYVIIHLLGPELHFSVSNHTSIGVYTSWIVSPFGLVLKHNFNTKNEKLNFSLGAVGGTMGYINSFQGFGALMFGNVTYGTRRDNVTFSVGASILNSNARTKYVINYYDTINNYSYNQYASNYSYYKRPTSFAVLLSLSGIKKISSKVSFIFESIVSLSKVERPNETQYTNSSGYNYYNYSYTSLNPFEGLFNNYPEIVTDQTYSFLRTRLSVFPAFRFQFSENKAFQLTLGSIHSFNEGVTKSFPLPMCSWFIKF
jgi:hypothetical protein